MSEPYPFYSEEDDAMSKREQLEGYFSQSLEVDTLLRLCPDDEDTIRTLCATCLRHFVEAKAFKIAIVPSADNSMDTCTVCQTRRGYDYVVMHR